MIPEDLKIFSLIYEYSDFVILPLLAIYAAGGLYLLFRLKKIFFLWLLIFPLVICPLEIAFTYCGWHYRMELRNRFAGTDNNGFADLFTSRPVDIDLMPPEIRAEYAKHDYHPRYRDMKTLVASAIVSVPILYVFGGLAFLIIFMFKEMFVREKPKTSGGLDKRGR